MSNTNSSQPAQRVRRALARGIGLGLLAFLTFVEVEAVTNFGIEKALGVYVGGLAGPDYKLTVPHSIFEAVVFLTVLAIGLVGMRCGRKCRSLLLGLLGIAGGAVLGSFWGYIPTSTAFGERLNFVFTSTVPTGTFWGVAGASLGWDGELPTFISNQSALCNLVLAVLVLCFLVVLLFIALLVGTLFFGL